MKKAKNFKIDAILGVGGGSVVDEAKAIALGVVVGEETLCSYFRKEKNIEAALPVYDILLTAQISPYWWVEKSYLRRKTLESDGHLYYRYRKERTFVPEEKVGDVYRS